MIMGGRGSPLAPRLAATTAAATCSARRYLPRRTTSRVCGCRRGLRREQLEMQVAERVVCCQCLSCMAAVVSSRVGLSAPRTPTSSTGAGFTATAASRHVCPQRISSSPFSVFLTEFVFPVSSPPGWVLVHNAVPKVRLLSPLADQAPPPWGRE